MKVKERSCEVIKKMTIAFPNISFQSKEAENPKQI
jgi:hypothetical protein